ncbi:MAG: alkylation repair enzyme [Mucilaginibacter sp.]|nr:alkylation repair enzyme [Mucilaginibacter sp.]
MATSNYPIQLKEVLAHLNSVQGNVPLHRQESRRVYSFSTWPFTEQMAVWDELWRTKNDFWIKLHAFFFLERHLKKDSELREMWPVIVCWQDQVNDWGLCDSLAKIYTKIMEVEAITVYKQLKTWNTDQDLWKRRQSVVSLLYYSRTKKLFLTFNEIEQLISPLLDDKEYYVQKGVGWSLRELHTVYPDETLPWLKAHIKLISSIAFTIAMEKMDAITRSELKVLRR